VSPGNSKAIYVSQGYWVGIAAIRGILFGRWLDLVSTSHKAVYCPCLVPVEIDTMQLGLTKKLFAARWENL
jgi:hypothetical protein